jgi:antitoxin VapB
MLSKIFKSGNSLAVRIPKELAFDGEGQEVEIERRGDVLWVRPVASKTLADIGDVFAMFSADFMADGRQFHEQKQRDWEPAAKDAD